MPSIPLVLKVQRTLKAAGFDPGKLDGIPGNNTFEALRGYLNVNVPDEEIDAVRVLLDYFGEANLTGTAITLFPIRMKHYTGKLSTFWLDCDVYESFVEAMESWLHTDRLRMTETLRTLAVQKSLKKRKPSLAAEPGWSLHGHGRAFDFDISTVPDLLEFYQHMAKYGWYNIYSKPGDVVVCPRNREAWHLQKVDPPGVHKNTYLKKWASTRCGLDSLFKLKYKKDSSVTTSIHY